MKPPSERAPTSAPPSSNAPAAARWFSAAAHISAVWPRQPSRRFGSAPRSRSTRTASARPVRAVVISAVSPSGVAQFGSAPASSRSAMNAALPFSHATPSGVASKRLAASTRAPAAISASAIARSSLSAAQWSAVVPSPSGALASSPCASNARVRSASPLRTASTSGASAAQAASPPVGAPATDATATATSTSVSVSLRMGSPSYRSAPPPDAPGAEGATAWPSAVGARVGAAGRRTARTRYGGVSIPRARGGSVSASKPPRPTYHARPSRRYGPYTSVRAVSRPVLSPSCSAGTPALPSMLISRLVIGVSFG